MKARPAIKHIDFEWLCVPLALWACLSFVWVAASSLAYPFHLEWMEGHIIDGVQRVREGLPLYAKPSLDYISFLYTPYYYYLTALVSLVTGVDFLPGRLVSFAAALATGAVIYRWLWRLESGWKVALCGAGGYFATYIVSGRWMDVARVDSLFVCLTLLGLYLFYYARGLQQEIVAAAVMVTAYFTKQTALIAFIPPFIAMLLTQQGKAFRVLSLFLLPVILLSWLGHVASDGWFTFYTFQLPSMHKMQTQQLIPFWTKDLLPQVGIMMFLASLMLLHWLYADWRKGLWYGALAAGFVGCSYSGRLNWGGFINVLMPACCILAMLAAMSIAYAGQAGRPKLAALASVLLAVQFIMLWYAPGFYIPTQASIDKGNRFLEELSHIKGEVLMPEVQFVQTRVGKKSYGLNMGALDIIVTDMKQMNYIKQDLLAEMRSAVEREQFAGIMPGGVVPVPGMPEHYRFSKTLSYPREYISQARPFLRRGLYLSNRYLSNTTTESRAP